MVLQRTAERSSEKRALLFFPSWKLRREHLDLTPRLRALGSGLCSELCSRPRLGFQGADPLPLAQSHVHVDTVNFQPPVPSPRGTGLTSCISRIFAGAGGSVQTMLVS